MTSAELAQRLTVTVPEASELLGVSEWAGYQAARADEFPCPVIRVGRRLVVPAAPLRQLLGVDRSSSPGASDS